MEKNITTDSGKKVRIALIQFSMTSDKNKNINKALDLVTRAAKKGSQIICLPELFSTLYFPQEEQSDARKYAELIPGNTTITFSRLAKKLRIVIIVPLYEATKDGRYYNSVVVIDENGKILDTYRKIHIPHDPLFYEKNYFQEGDAGFKIIRTTYATIAPLICFDQWFPEAARIAALNGADIIFYPTAIGWITNQKTKDDWHDAWLTIQRSHAIANNVFVASVNRVGTEKKLDFWGTSFVCDPFGKLLAQGSSHNEEIIIADLTLENTERLRNEWGFFAKRRPQEYSLIHDQSFLDVQKKTPLQFGYSYPAEWEKHKAVLLAWPYDKLSFPHLQRVEEEYVRIINTLQKSEEIFLFVTGSLMKERAMSLLRKNNVDVSSIRFFEMKYGDVWFRDYGPTFIVQKQKKKLAMVKWNFNAYGCKYDELLVDNTVPLFLNKFMNLPYFNSGIFMEGGAIEINGKGTLLTTEQCLLNKNRNPELNKQNVEHILKQFLNVSHVVWLKHGLVGDDTDGHVDNLARFVNPSTILCSFEDDKKDVNYASLKENYDILCTSKDQDGKPFTVIKIPVPKLFVGKHRVSASYANFYIANKTVLVPQFTLSTDKKALDMISRYFPARNVVGIDCSFLIRGGGTLHCITQQIPHV